MSIKKTLIKKLIEIGVIHINMDKWFLFSSGFQSPIYCDNRKILSHVETRKYYIKPELLSSISENFPQVEVIAGVSTSGIPFGMMLAEHLNLPFIYVRSKPKGYGLEKMIEGDLKEGQRVLVIEDLITTGKSSFNVVEILKNAGADVIGVQAIFTYLFKESIKLFEDANVKLCSLTDFNALLDHLRDENLLHEVNYLHAWYEDDGSHSIYTNSLITENLEKKGKEIKKEF